MRKSLILFLLVTIFFLSFPTNVFANGDNYFVTVVNPIRISRYTKDIRVNLESQYAQVEKRNLSATWLLTYDVLEEQEAIDVLKKMDARQEMGLFLEVVPAWAQSVGVEYNKTDSWHRAKSVFLSGYLQEERGKLIDGIFERFKQIFGYYPASVGSWWTDSYSLAYMEDKYGIKTNLGVADQFTTDGYQIWGTYWSTPYYPSRYHLGIPSGSEENKIEVVNLQWAPREIDRGYKSSLYSTQDYLVVSEKLDISFFENLVRTYGFAKGNSFGQIVVGLEGDLSPGAYQGEYTKQLDKVNELKEEGLQDVTMSEFAKWYGENYDLSPPQKYESGDVVWYQSPYYRAGVRFNNGKIRIFDLRVYMDDFSEPYYLVPNGELNLSSYIPAVLDEVQNEELVWEFAGNKDQLEFREDRIIIKKLGVLPPAKIKKSGLLKIRRGLGRVEIIPKKKFLVGREGYVFKSLSVITKYFLRGKRNIASLFLGKNWDQLSLDKYWVSQAEMDVLRVLASLPSGRVLVYDHECLGCEWDSVYQPAAYANIRRYVRKFGGKRVVQNQKVFEPADREESLKEFQETKAKYVYLVKYGSEVERLPFEPGDLGVTKVYENANAVLWKVK